MEKPANKSLRVTPETLFYFQIEQGLACSSAKATATRGR